MNNTTYIVIYDVSKDGNYDELYKKLKSYNGWAKITESAWAVVSTLKAPELRTALKPFIGKDGRLFVVKSGKAAGWSNIIASNEWFKKNL